MIALLIFVFRMPALIGFIIVLADMMKAGSYRCPRCNGKVFYFNDTVGHQVSFTGRREYASGWECKSCGAVDINPIKPDDTQEQKIAKSNTGYYERDLFKNDKDDDHDDDTYEYPVHDNNAIYAAWLERVEAEKLPRLTDAIDYLWDSQSDSNPDLDRESHEEYFRQKYGEDGDGSEEHTQLQISPPH